jgi:hypothetical protein
MSRFREWRERRSMRNVARPYGRGLDLTARQDGTPNNPRDYAQAQRERRLGRLETQGETRRAERAGDRIQLPQGHPERAYARGARKQRGRSR